MNDRLDDSYTLIAPAAVNIQQGSTFTVSDGINTVTFQLIDSSYSGGDPNDVPVDISYWYTAEDVAAAIVKAVNGAESKGLLNVTASVVTDSSGDPIGDQVNLFGAARVVTLDTISSTAGGHAQTLVHDSQADDFDGNLDLQSGAGDAPTPTDTTYYVWSQWGGTPYTGNAYDYNGDPWSPEPHYFLDAEKTPPGDNDDLMCWAAAASNILTWTGWGNVSAISDQSDQYEADEIFKYFQDHWTDEGSWPTDAWSWWFDGNNPDSGIGASEVTAAGGDFFREARISPITCRSRPIRPMRCSRSTSSSTMATGLPSTSTATIPTTPWPTPSLAGVSPTTRR